MYVSLTSPLQIPSLKAQPQDPDFDPDLRAALKEVTIRCNATFDIDNGIIKKLEAWSNERQAVIDRMAEVRKEGLEEKSMESELKKSEMEERELATRDRKIAGLELAEMKPAAKMREADK